MGWKRDAYEMNSGAEVVDELVGLCRSLLVYVWFEWCATLDWTVMWFVGEV